MSLSFAKVRDRSAVGRRWCLTLSAVCVHTDGARPRQLPVCSEPPAALGVPVGHGARRDAACDRVPGHRSRGGWERGGAAERRGRARVTRVAACVRAGAGPARRDGRGARAEHPAPLQRGRGALPALWARERGGGPVLRAHARARDGSRRRALLADTLHAVHGVLRGHAHGCGARAGAAWRGGGLILSFQPRKTWCCCWGLPLWARRCWTRARAGAPPAAACARHCMAGMRVRACAAVGGRRGAVQRIAAHGIPDLDARVAVELSRDASDRGQRGAIEARVAGAGACGACVCWACTPAGDTQCPTRP